MIGTMTIRDALARGHDAFRSADTATPYLDAVILLAHAGGISKEQLFARLTEPLDEQWRAAFQRAVEARAAGTPVAYLTGAKEFYGREFRVDRRALIPRPDTEVLVDAVLELVRRDFGSAGGPRHSGEAAAAGDVAASAHHASGGTDDAPGSSDAAAAVAAAGRHSGAAAAARARDGREIPTAARRRLRIHDCCSGTGCIAITLAAELAGGAATADTAHRDVRGSSAAGAEADAVAGAATGAGSASGTAAAAATRTAGARIDGGARASAHEVDAGSVPELTASDLSGEALELLRENSVALLGRELPVWQSDLLDNVPGQFDIITANPPYVAVTGVQTAAATDIAATQAVGEPELALAAGDDGLSVLRRLIPQAFSKLNTRGYFVTEIGFDQEEAVYELFVQSGFADIEVRKDLEDRARVCLGRR